MVGVGVRATGLSSGLRPHKGIILGIIRCKLGHIITASVGEVSKSGPFA